uniref:CCHC-type domain-containing protein n=1 Tax=Tanacetum cinerariifolium TaxID=118510 RepID=A0A6L2JNK1_TANCI|nr:hypothetical protein [Tanacetum cinerariifolium]
MLLMALPNEYLLTFNQYKDAKTLFESIQVIFGGNDAIKKTQRTLLKHMYENFNAPIIESLDSIFNTLQKIVSQLAILGETISQEYLNMNNNEVDTASIQVSAASTTVSTISSPDNTAKLSDATVYAFLANQPNGSQLVHEDLEKIHEDDLEEMDLKWQLALLSIRARRYFQRTGKKITINGSDTAWYDKTKVECFSCHKMRHFARDCRSPMNQESRPRNQKSSRKTVIVEDTSSKAMVAINEAGFDWSYMANDEVPTNMAFMAFSDSEGAPQVALKDQGYFNSGCFRHMTGNISYLTDFNEHDGGYVAFGGGAKGSKTTGKGTIRTGKLDFEDVYFVKELQFNLFSVSQMCDKKNSVLFTDTECFVLSLNFKLANESQVLLKVPIKNNMYSFDMKNIVPQKDLTCLLAKAINDKSMLLHRRLVHINFKNINKLVTDNLVRGLPSKHFKNNQTCVACIKVNQHKVSFTSKLHNSISQPLFMLHIDLFGPTSVEEVNTACYVQNRVLVVKPHFKTPYGLFKGKFDGKSDDGIFVGYSTTSKTFKVYNIRTRKVEENLHINFLENKPMIAGGGPEWLFDLDALSKSINYALVFAGTNSNDFAGKGASFNAGQSSMETGSSQDYILMLLWKDTSLFDSSSQVSDSHNKDKHGPAQASESDNQKRPNAESSTKTVNTTGPVNTATPTYDEYPNDPFMPDLEDVGIFDDAYDDRDRGAEADYNNLETVILLNPIPSTRIHKDHPKEHIIGEVNSVVHTRKMAKQNEAGLISFINKQRRTNHKDFQNCLFTYFLSQMEPKKTYLLEKELLEPNGSIKTREIKEGLLSKITGWLFLAYASFMDFTVYQMDVKSAFLYGTIKEEVYVSLPPGFVDPEFPDKVFKRETIDKTLFIKKIKDDILLVQVYVDDIIFGSTKRSLSTEFEQLMHKRFQMNSMGELTFFLGLQVEQRKDDIFLSQDKYVSDILKKFGFSSVKSASTPMETHKPLSKDAARTDVDVYLYRSMIGSLMYRPDIMFAVCAWLRFQVQPKVSHMHAVKRIFRYLKGQPTLVLWYPKDLPLELIAYSDSDYAGVSLDRKSTTGGCQFLDYGYNFMRTKIHVDNESAICVVKNLVYHSKTKHIEIRHHFIRDLYEKRFIEMVKIHIDYNVADLLTKAFDVTRVNIKESSIRRILRLEDADGTSCLTNAEIFKGLARMGYEKPSDKLTFYKAFFFPKWKFLIHTILQCLSAKTTSWNEFSSTIASAIICLATNQKFNFSRYVLLSLVKNIEVGVPFFMFPRLGTGFSREVTSLFDNMLVQASEEVPPAESPAEQNLPSPSHDPLASGKDSLKLKELMYFCTNLSNKVLDSESEVIDIKSTYQARIGKLESRVERLEEENKVLKKLKSVHFTIDYNEPVMGKEKSSKQERKIAVIDSDVEINLEKAQAEAYNLDLDHQEKVLSMLDVNDKEPTDVEEVLEVVKAAKLITKVVTTVGVDVNAFSVQDTPITAAEATKKHYNYNQAFLNEVNEGVEVPKKELSQEKEVKVESSKREDATPLDSKIPIIDYKIHTERNRPYFKIIRADGNHRERFAKTESKNYSDDFLLNTLKIIFKKPNVEANIFLLVERMYPLTHFTLEQLINDVRLEVKDESEMSLELLRLVRRQLNEGYIPQ